VSFDSYLEKTDSLYYLCSWQDDIAEKSLFMPLPRGQMNTL
jgi:hypothetical protein